MTDKQNVPRDQSPSRIDLTDRVGPAYIVGTRNRVLFPRSTIPITIDSEVDSPEIVQSLYRSWRKHGNEAKPIVVTKLRDGYYHEKNPHRSHEEVGVLAFISSPNLYIESTRDGQIVEHFSFTAQCVGRVEVEEFHSKDHPLTVYYRMLFDDPDIRVPRIKREESVESSKFVDPGYIYWATCENILATCEDFVQELPREFVFHLLLAIEKIKDSIEQGNFEAIEEQLFGQRVGYTEGFGRSIKQIGVYPLFRDLLDKLMRKEGRYFRYFDDYLHDGQIILEKNDPNERLQIFEKVLMHLFCDLQDEGYFEEVAQNSTDTSGGVAPISSSGGDVGSAKKRKGIKAYDHILQRVSETGIADQKDHGENLIVAPSEFADALSAIDTEKKSPTTKKVQEFFDHNLIGQPIAAKRFIRAWEILEAGFHLKNQPIYSVLNLGPSGVGKTLSAKLFAKLLFDDFNGITFVECVKYSNRWQLSELVGSSAGYIGYDHMPLLAQERIDRPHYLSLASGSDEVGRLTDELENLGAEISNKIDKLGLLLEEKGMDALENGDEEVFALNKEIKKLDERYQKIKQRIEGLSGLKYDPSDNYYSVIVFDEFEKAHEALVNFVLTILSEGRLQMNNPKFGTTDFTRSILVFTSNLGRDEIRDTVTGKQLGFQSSVKSSNDVDQEIYTATKGIAKKELPPEFLGRIGDMIVFRPLDEDEISEIFDLELERFQRELLDKKFRIHIRVDENLKKFIVNESMDAPEQGARLLKKKIKKYLNLHLARLKNADELSSGDTIVAILENADEYDKKDESFKPKIVFRKIITTD